MNILDKLAVSLLVCCGMLVGQMERSENQHGNLVQSKDPSGQTATFLYDVEGRLSKTRINCTPPLMSLWCPLQLGKTIPREVSEFSC